MPDNGPPQSISELVYLSDINRVNTFYSSLTVVQLEAPLKEHLEILISPRA